MKRLVIPVAAGMSVISLSACAPRLTPGEPVTQPSGKVKTDLTPRDEDRLAELDL